jgi:site-specific DNA-methyltransferase (adenine-specific)
MPKKDMTSSGNNKWETPAWVFDHFNRIFNFECDVAASEDNKKCDIYFTEKENGLIQPWYYRNWCNPPYGRNMIAPWLAKAYEEGCKGNLTVVLIPVATSTLWWSEWVKKADYVYYYPQRINFLRDGKEVKGVSFDSCAVIYGLNPKRKTI